MTIILLILLASGISACVEQGDFCDLYEPIKLEREVAQMVVSQDRGSAVMIATHNDTWGRQCSWMMQTTGATVSQWPLGMK